MYSYMAMKDTALPSELASSFLEPVCTLNILIILVSKREAIWRHALLYCFAVIVAKINLNKFKMG